MNIFVVNSGSSSIKYQLFKMPNPEPFCSGLVERIGAENATIKHKIFTAGKEDVIEEILNLPNHKAGLQRAVALLTNEQHGVIKSPEEIEVVGHRVVHGGEKYSSATIITQDVKDNIKQLFSLAPLHNPANYTGIEVAEDVFTKATQVAIFDTAFHQTLPEHAFRYAIPPQFYTDMGIRVYGFHGTSHKYVTQQAMLYLDNPAAKLISIHLGNGCSMAAVKEGEAIDTSMGFGPLNGLIMGTRSGEIDPSVIFHLIDNEGYTSGEVSTLLNKKSGMLGLAGSNDMRDVNKAVERGNAEAKLARNMYAYRIKKYIGAYAAVLNGLDAIIFTAGVGENDDRVRKSVCHDLDFLGIEIDEEKNNSRGSGIREINRNNARVKILVVPTNEELEIAQQCFELLSNAQ